MFWIFQLVKVHSNLAEKKKKINRKINKIKTKIDFCFSFYIITRTHIHTHIYTYSRDMSEIFQLNFKQFDKNNLVCSPY